MQFSDRFLNLVDLQLKSFDSYAGIEHIVVYVAKNNSSNSPSLEVIGQRPKRLNKFLTPLENDPEVRVPSPFRRWYPLQEGSILLGVLRVERLPAEQHWPESLDHSLQASASVIANCLSLELDRKKLLNELNQQRDDIGMLVHQLKNPLAALRTYAQLLLRKLGPESSHRGLVEGLLSEQEQVGKYLLSLDEFTQPKLVSQSITPSRLLLPPLISNEEPIDLLALLRPLIDRAEANAKLQGRKWIGPANIPAWMKKLRPASEGFIAEIVANLLENAFKYSSSKSSIGICFSNDGICVWDDSEPIDLDEREKIFENGFRSKKNQNSVGSGIGLSVGRKLAKQFGGELKLNINPSSFDQSLPKVGNAFVINLQG
ncbi:sensor histidine kinase [Prochlorococcus marinus]|uniref:sensor histidine kinase n=1 Tax=Prochlorococcus marinus TaxID=1219 RepID=UPI0022B5C7A1|nr:ATP-binding protein [Prochlorococcus marinus]